MGSVVWLLDLTISQCNVYMFCWNSKVMKYIFLALRYDQNFREPSFLFFLNIAYIHCPRLVNKLNNLFLECFWLKVGLL